MSRVPWVVTEKIHGANFCLVTNGLEVRAASRKAYLDEDDEFFGYRVVLEKYRKAVLALAAERAPIELLFVYGELFGGAYPHPDVPPNPNAQPVQSGVYYSPNLEFCAFDVGVLEQDELRLLDYEIATQALGRVGIPFAKPLFIGRYDAASMVSHDFDTTVPAQLGLPPLAGNRAEGIVLKPYSGSALRPSVKKKIEAFAETRFHAVARSHTADSPLLQLTAASNAMCTPQRLDNALSKIGRVKPGDRKRREAAVGELVSDVMATLADQATALWKRLPQRDRDGVRDHVRARAEALLAAKLGER